MTVGRRWSLWGGASCFISLLIGCWIARAEIPYQQVHSFGFMGAGGTPQAALLVGPDGTLYGTTYRGGNSDRGTIFALNPDGSQFRVLHDFMPAVTDGARPYGELLLGTDGAIYGTTELGGTNGYGTIFKINPDGSGYEVIYHFVLATGVRPRGQLVQGPDGALYGTTQQGGPIGGSGGAGTVYTIRPDGTAFRMLQSVYPGADPDTGLTLASDGRLYGVCSTGFTNPGTVFGLNTDGSGFAVLHYFEGTTPGVPVEADGRLLELSDGMLYGTTMSTIYRINKDGSGFEVILRSTATGVGPFWSGMVLGEDGALYGAAVDAVIKIQPDGSGLEVLHRFVNPSVGDGYFGYGLSVGLDGALYGVTSSGGTNGQGTVFRMLTDGTDYSILHHFRAQTNSASLPRASMVPVGSGMFFGTTESGGPTNGGTIFSLKANGSDARLRHIFGLETNSAKVPNRLCDGGDGFFYGTTSQGGNSSVGTIFRIDTNGSNFSVVRHFGLAAEPRGPRGGLIKGTDGWFYGTSSSGGSANRGTVYKFNKLTGELLILRNLATADGQQPQCELVQDAEGALFGTGSISGAQNLGTVYRIAPDGTDFVVLHSFTGGAAGQNPMSGLMLASDGRLYGTTPRQFGSFAGCIYRLNTDGTGFQALKSFPVAGSGPKAPRPVLTEAPDGMLYGAALSGGAANKGLMFRIAKDGADFEVLREFGISAGDGETPSAGFTAVGDGSFLGVTEAGGNGNGTVFRFDPVDARLRLEITPSTAQLRWAASSTLDTLELTSGTDGFDWHPSGAAVTRAGNENQASVPRQGSGQFFRVRRLWE